jgi:hypothetical protein
VSKKSTKKAAAAPKDKINKKKIEQEYGLSYALFKSNSELNKLLKDATAGSWTAQKFQVELRNTKWFQKHSDTWREATALKYSDPSTYKQKVAEQLTTVKALAGQYGATLDADGLNKLAEQSLLFGWSNGDIQTHLANYVTPSSSGNYGGDLASIQSSLEQTALANGVRVGDSQMQNWMQAIVKGQASQDQYEKYIRDTAAKTFSAYGDQIKAGMNVSDLASPYIQSMGQVLELNPDSIDMFDPTIRKAMSYVDPKTGKPSAMSITDFENGLRQDQRWQYTKQANDAARGIADALGKMWGKV